MKQLLILIIIAFSLTIKANAQIDAEIKSFVDSTELIFNNGRKLMAKSIENNDLVKAKEAYDYLKQKADDSKYSAFGFTEDLYFNILIADWENVFKIAKSYNQYTNKLFYNNTFNIINIVWSDINDNIESLSNNLSNKNLNPEDKEVMSLFLLVIKRGKSDKEYSSRLKAYKKMYPANDYKEFIKFYLPAQYVHGAMAFSIGSGVILPQGNLSSSFNSNASYNFSMDININRIYSSLYLNGSSLKLQTPFSVKNDSRTLDFNINESFNYLDGGLKGGYFIVRNKRFHFAPFGSLSGSFIKSNRYNTENDENEFNAINTFSYGFGIHNEIKIKVFNYNTLYNTETSSYISFKVDAGYNFHTSQSHINFKGDIVYVSASLVWGLGEF